MSDSSADPRVLHAEADRQGGTDLDPGLALNHETRRWLHRLRALPTPDTASAPDNRRQRFEVSELLAEEFTRRVPSGVVAQDHHVGRHDVLVREFRPATSRSELPAYVFLHGGAFWHGSVRERVNHAIIADRVARTGVAAFALEYRLAPEHPYPAAIEDTQAVLGWLRASAGDVGIDPERIVLGGVSAGASIAAATAGRVGATDLAGLVLEVPAIDLRDDGCWDRRFAAVNGLESPEEMARIYAPDLDPGHPEVSPMLSEAIASFPRTHVMTAEYDPLRPGGEILATRLRHAGVDVTATRHLGALHGVPGLTANDPIAQGWHDEVCAVLIRLCGRRNPRPNRTTLT